MPRLARVLQFPQRSRSTRLSAHEAARAAELFLSTERDSRTAEAKTTYLADMDVLLAICSRLKEERDRSPEIVGAEALEIYEFVLSSESVGVFDERKYLLGEFAHLVAGSHRLLGRRDQAEVWLCRAESAFRSTVNPAACLTQVSYTRLALLYDMGRHEAVLELLPDVRATFAELGMSKDLAKASLFQAMVLKMLERAQEAFEILDELVHDDSVRTDPALFGRVLVDFGDTQQLLGWQDEAIRTFQQALPLLRAARQPMAVANLQLVVGSSYRNAGSIANAIDAFAQAKANFSALGMRTTVAYVSVLRAEALLAIGKYREAEMELVGALPTIEEQKMVPEGFAAVALLKESVRRRKTDPNALRELREHLQANQ